MKRIHLILLCCLMLAACAQQIDYSPYQDKLNIYLVNDMGRNGYYDQKPLASLSREPEAVEGTVFCSAEPGFSILSADIRTLTLRMIDKHGRFLHAVERRH